MTEPGLEAGGALEISPPGRCHHHPQRGEISQATEAFTPARDPPERGANPAGRRNGKSLLAGVFRVTRDEGAFLDGAKSPKARRAFADSGGLINS
jgi:hypothetical protein